MTGMFESSLLLYWLVLVGTVLREGPYTYGSYISGCEAAGDAADRAGERAREARALAERACLDRHPRRAIAVRRLRSAAEEELNACLAADADGDAADEAREALDASNAGLEVCGTANLKPQT